jgi:hypothetical protein
MLRHSPQQILPRRVGLSKTNSVRRSAGGYADPESNIMGKRKTKEQQDKETLAEVVKEMAKPRVVMSARERSPTFRNTLLVVKDNVEE